ncbi:RNA-guided endonuclease InsQ/TnpB family protein, partial [Pantanalinema sp. GBBB05]|uniref:RNA-guided endonuclease InsQ/TnpB family protein n=1 Tax=Pantanalinema sp. GBBB05 TaxID=2604139 RepID=UPI003D81A88E
LWFGTKLTETIPKPHSVVEFPLSAIMLKAGHSMGCKFPDKSIVVVVDDVVEPQTKFETSRTAGFDFGLKTFLTCSEGFKIESPQFLKQSLHAIQKASRELSRKAKGSHSREQARLNLCRKHEDIANRRRDWFWKLAHNLTAQFDVLCFESLNLKGMQRLWGRKVNDIAFREFMHILEWVAKKKDKLIVYVSQ